MTAPRRWSFSLGMVFVGVTALGCFFGWLVSVLNEIKARRELWDTTQRGNHVYFFSGDLKTFGLPADASDARAHISWIRRALGDRPMDVVVLYDYRVLDDAEHFIPGVDAKIAGSIAGHFPEATWVLEPARRIDPPPPDIEEWPVGGLPLPTSFW